MATTWHLLPPDLIELQLGQIDLLMAMYPEELVLEEWSQKTIDRLRDGSLDASVFGNSAPSVSMLLRLSIDSGEAQSLDTRDLDLDLTVPFAYLGEIVPEEPPSVKVRVQQPPWLNRAATNQIMSDLPEGEDLLGTIEHIKDAAPRLERLSKTAAISTSSTAIDSLVRVWFYFPSISTRSKRDDFIIHAPSYSLTGFLYAGKPGLLCVEGPSQNIDDYMKFIKTESWGDIPAHHKKVSERYREKGEGGDDLGIERVFPDMTEITDTVGERRGHRVNRGDMKAIEEWLVERGLGEAFNKVLM